ncbi:MAG: hypothetical protein ACFUZC_04940 [Chthoniobacteraceae bacterium]
MTPEEKQRFLYRELEKIGEHFDSVQILASEPVYEPGGGTRPYYCGTGNWYARVGLAREFLTRDQVRVEIQEKRNIDEPDG